jgi:hypothetical protein
MPVFQAAGDLVISDQADLDQAHTTGRWIRVSRGQEDVHANR